LNLNLKYAKFKSKTLF